MRKPTLLLAPEKRCFIVHCELERILLSTPLFNNKFGISWLNSAFITGKDNFSNLISFIYDLLKQFNVSDNLNAEQFIQNPFLSSQSKKTTCEQK